ncbi:MAG TPA: response regulator, partial [Flavobacteriales bacterium]|nr:response regulator [Flavobacteriales bacterium]
MDVQMPELDGIAATIETRALPGPASRVPIIALTASVLPSDLGRCIDAGMDACLSKPFRTENLLVTIERLIGDPGSALPLSSSGTSASAYDSLFKSQAPQDLDDLRHAVNTGDKEAIARAVHRMRPQLVHRDRARFAPLCDEALRQAQRGDIVASTQAAELLISKVENELARA